MSSDANQCNEWLWDCPSERFLVVGGYLMPLVEVEELGGGSNDGVTEMNLVILREM